MRKWNIWYFAAFDTVYYLAMMLLFGGKIQPSDPALPVIGTDWLFLCGLVAFLALSLFLPPKKVSFAVLGIFSLASGIYPAVRYGSAALSFFRVGTYYFPLFVLAMLLSGVLAAICSFVQMFRDPGQPAA